jgi:hypothetical protein
VIAAPEQGWPNTETTVEATNFRAAAIDWSPAQC